MISNWMNTNDEKKTVHRLLSEFVSLLSLQFILKFHALDGASEDQRLD